jgi:hypothetical protein
MIEIPTIRNQKLTLRLVMIGEDLSFSLSGGEVPHIGALAIGHLNAKGDVELMCYGLPGHKEKDIAASITREFVEKLNRTVTLNCGIHFKDITKHEISLVMQDIERIKVKFFNETTLM